MSSRRADEPRARRTAGSIGWAALRGLVISAYGIGGAYGAEFLALRELTIGEECADPSCPDEFWPMIAVLGAVLAGLVLAPVLGAWIMRVPSPMAFGLAGLVVALIAFVGIGLEVWSPADGFFTIVALSVPYVLTAIRVTRPVRRREPSAAPPTAAPRDTMASGGIW